MTLHIIHLSRRQDRLVLLQGELAAQKVDDFRIWEGIENTPHPYIGIARAHKKIVSYAKDEKYASVLIGEDDIRFTAPGALAYFLTMEPPDYDLYLGGISWGNISKDQTVSDFSGTHLYMVRESFYDMFLSIPETGDIDRNLKNRGRYIVCHPFVALQHNGFSDNKKRNMNFDPYFSGRNLFTG